MLTSWYLNEKSREVCIKARSPPTSLVFIGEVTKHTTVKWPIELTYNDFPCHLKLNRDKLALIKRRGSLKGGKRLEIATGSLVKIDQHDNFTCAVSRRYRER